MVPKGTFCRAATGWPLTLTSTFGASDARWATRTCASGAPCARAGAASASAISNATPRANTLRTLLKIKPSLSLFAYKLNKYVVDQYLVKV